MVTLTIFRFLVTLRNTNSPHLVSNSSLTFPKRFFCYCFEKPPMPATSSSQIVAEYAKSNRSTCTKCSATIASNSLRLGLVTRDPRGFNKTKWHHLDCFPIGSETIVSAQAIKGFSSLKGSDQESLEKLVDGDDKTQKKESDEYKSLNEGSDIRIVDEDAEYKQDERDSKERKIHMPDEDVDYEQDKRDSKKIKSNHVEPELDIAFTVSDVKNKYKDATLLPNWKAFQTVIFLEQDVGLHNSSKIAAFDFDGCLVNTSVKRIGPDAWSLMYSSVPEKLQYLHHDGYKLVIFTNESNIERWNKKRQLAVDSKIGRLINFINEVKVPIQVFVACGIGKSGGSQAEDPFRKPKPGMWRLMEQHFNSGVSIDMQKSFYVGDAAGRPKDHGDADIKFAEAIGLKFYVPEEYFGA
ncbi:polynucleotide 3'-phosphatase ZDP [Quillaja saponaria]|uniref:Polynucleotide 3'-phosphatase ZDP n=1 Tax=Quillaja saponaria TaxID=32244 RepID=A0AAD7QHX3_QUISA|nr:polynucleotide 3'-phosphatase ZDP [Quillaja saponaria]